MIMRRKSLLTLCVLAFSLLLAPLGYSQDATPAKPAVEVSQAAVKPRARPRGRVPNHYGKLNLSEAQRERIYGIQATYQEQVAKLEQQLMDLKRREADDLAAVLTPAQRMQLQELLTAAQNRRKNMTTASTEAPANPAPAAAPPKTEGEK